MNKRLLIGTANVSKLPYLMEYFEDTDIECVSPAALGLARFDAPENAKTAGIIIRPAIIAIPVSNISTFLVEDSIGTSFFIYEPKVTRIPIAIDRE